MATPALRPLRKAAFWTGCRHAFGVPAAVLVAGMIGFGALGQASGLSLGVTTAATIFMYALPGQVVFAEMMALGASGVAIALAAALTAARFLPMTMTLLPQVPQEDRDLTLYAKSHLISMTTWAIMMRDFSKLEPQARLAYFTGFGLVCWGCSIPSTVMGYLVAGHVPVPITLGLIMINPLFFLLTFTEVKTQFGRLALLTGGLSGPLVYSLSPSWSILISGLLGGTLAFLIDASLRQKAAK
jgi:predicted branched-subunit amino acid permease